MGMFSPLRHSSCKPSRWKAFSLEIDLFNHQFKRNNLGNSIFENWISKLTTQIWFQTINCSKGWVLIQKTFKSNANCFIFVFFLVILEYQGKGPKRWNVFISKKKLLLLDIILFLGVSPEKIGASAKVREIPLKKTRKELFTKGNKYHTYRFCFQYLQASFESGGASRRQDMRHTETSRHERRHF